MSGLIWFPIGVVVVVVVIQKLYQYTSGVCKTTHSLKNRVMLVTGSSAGIGRETAKELYRRGASVVMLCRNEEKALNCRREIVREIGATGEEGKLDIAVVDLSKLRSVNECADRLLKDYNRIDVLINNAGQGAQYKMIETEDNLEHTMATNYFGHFLLTERLLDRIKESNDGRVINVSSMVYWVYGSQLSMDSLNFNNEKYGGFKAYCRTKWCQIMHALYMSKIHQRKEGKNSVGFYSHNPGNVGTDISADFVYSMVGNAHLGRLLTPAALCLDKLTSKSPLQGCQTSLHLATAPRDELTNGGYYSDCALKEVSEKFVNPEVMKSLYQKSLELVGLKKDQ